ncbi:Acetyltransferase (GNAT) family protein [Palleronia marisminoris]|uniref:Putative N-acetyltransferase YafP n=1 Tax=Palleronia marisminoris TaxID=315423 RepID=A0A1Y5SH22_9RHOB|nr:Acetyltransferase (GNAT) family protein [Palleronia marisminoris]SLN39496.1 putative N-acetyltransferase YafP [Palleronia marisminoris]
MPWLPVVHSADEDLWFFSTIVIPAENVWVARDGSDVAGFVSANEGWLNHLYVDPGYWRRGIGSELLSEARADADELQLWTFQRNTDARRFYAAHGFDECELTDGQDNEERTPDVRMVWVRRR